MRYGSVCSGIEAASMAWNPLGWTAQWFSEIEAFPSAVLAQRHPGVPNLGDMTKFKEWPDAAIDVLVGGTPCQSFSVAGLRKGLADPRGNLMLTYLAIADKYRPKWVVWENVPGVLSSGGGNDFASLLRGLGELGYGFAYRILDAQHFGVPQRRRRVFVVGHLGDWRRAAAVLFERHSLQGNPAPRREAGKVIAPSLDVRAGRSGETTFHTSGGLVPEVAGSLGGSSQSGGFRTTDLDGTGAFIPSVANPLTARMHKGVNTTMDEGQTMVGVAREQPLAPTFIHLNKGRPDGRKSAHTPMVTLEEESIPTLTTDGHAQSAIAFKTSHYTRGKDGAPSETMPPLSADADKGDQDAVVLAPVVFDTTQISSPGNYSSPKPGDPSHPLAAGAHPPTVAFAQNQVGEIRTDLNTLNTLNTNSNASGRNTPMIQAAMQVRRLTPRECERLQGFPDGYTLVTVRGKPAADGPRYKALGNSMAVPVMAWIGQRIQMVEDLT